MSNQELIERLRARADHIAKQLPNIAALLREAATALEKRGL
jgi:hypothetical protein